MSVRDFINQTVEPKIATVKADQDPAPVAHTTSVSSPAKAETFESIFGVTSEGSQSFQASKTPSVRVPIDKEGASLKEAIPQKSLEEKKSVPAKAPLPVKQGSQNSSSVNPQEAYAKGNYDLALSIWKKQAENNNPTAHFWLGRLYNSGKGVEKNTKKAYFHWKKASRLGSQEAATALANMQSGLSDKQLLEMETSTHE
jgi:hypothetical protein